VLAGDLSHVRWMLLAWHRLLQRRNYTLLPRTGRGFQLGVHLCAALSTASAAFPTKLYKNLPICHFRGKSAGKKHNSLEGATNIMSAPGNGTSLLRALLVSSDPATTTQLTQSMDQFAIHTEVCTDLALAMRMLNLRKFDAIVLDLTLGGKAQEVLERIRFCPANETAVTFAITDRGHPNPGSHARPNFVIEKPLSAALVSRTLKAAFGLIVRECRRYFRAPLVVSADIDSNATEHLRCQTVNISEGGLAVIAPSPLTPGTQVKIGFVLPGQKIHFHVECEICWCDDKQRAGLQFLSLTTEQQEALQQWLSARLEQSLPESVARQFNRPQPDVLD
jgi:PilZ domain